MSETYDFDVFRVERKLVFSGDGTSQKFSILRCPDWVNIIAFTSDERLALVRQFRHGIGEKTLEFPGGIVDGDLDSLNNAKRELNEEAGLGSAEWYHLGSFRPNAALQNNWCHTYLCNRALPLSNYREEGCDILLIDAPTFVMKYRHELLQQALMATAIMLAKIVELPADLRRLCDMFFVSSNQRSLA